MNKPSHTIPSLSGTFGIPERLAHSPEMPKEPSSPSRSNTRIERQCIIQQIDDKIEQGQRTTRGIKHWGLGGYLNVLPRIKFGVVGQESSSQSPTISYRHTLGARLENYSN